MAPDHLLRCDLRTGHGVAMHVITGFYSMLNSVTDGVSVALSCCTRRNFWTLPVGVVGRSSASEKTTRLGTLNRASFARQIASTSASVSTDPGARTTTTHPI